MDIKQMLLDTTDQQNHARWKGYVDALHAIANEMASMNKDKNIEHIQIPGKIMQHIKDECEKYDKLILSTDIGKTMDRISNG